MSDENPILFSSEMVRSILSSRKTQTRRVVKLKPIEPDGFASYGPEAMAAVLRRCPYGVPGDRLWVREPWRVHKNYDTFDAATIWIASGGDMEGCVHYEATAKRHDWAGRYRYARFMPRWASRITLEIVNVRVERLNNISVSDAIAEGVNAAKYLRGDDDMAVHLSHQDRELKQNLILCDYPIDRFRVLWDSINAKRAPWYSNPWVWVIEFKVVL